LISTNLAISFKCMALRVELPTLLGHLPQWNANQGKSFFGAKSRIRLVARWQMCCN